MKLKELQKAIQALVSVEATTAPILSCYVNLAQNSRDYRHALQERVRALRRALEPGEREAFELALARIESHLEVAVDTQTTGGVALFAREIDGPFFQALHFEVALPNRLSIGAFPSIYNLVELKDTYHRYVVLITTKDHVRILEVDVGKATSRLWAQRPELRKRVGSIWSREHYQKHQADRRDKFIKEKIQMLTRIVASGSHTHVILAGHAEAVARVRARLPKALLNKLVEISGGSFVLADNSQWKGSARARDSDIVASTLASFIEHEQHESVLTVERLKEELRRGGLAVAGARESLMALRQGQVDVLVMAEVPGWTCLDCGALADEAPLGTGCPECGKHGIRTILHLQEDMVRLAEQQGATVEIVRESDALLALGGVGCLLRYLTPEQHAESARIENAWPAETIS